MIETVHPCPHVALDADCPRCHGDGFYTVELHPDPLRAPGTDGYHQQPAPIYDRQTSWLRAWMTACFAGLVILGIVLALVWVGSTVPRGTPAPSPAPRAGSNEGPRAEGRSLQVVDRASAQLGAPLGAPLPAAGASFLLAGKATHYPACSRCAAAGPDLRARLGPHYIGKTVRVTLEGGRRFVDVRLVTSCACGDRDGSPTIIDLSVDSFLVLAPQGDGPNPGWQGVLDVEVTPVAGGPRPTLPATDTVR